MRIIKHILSFGVIVSFAFNCAIALSTAQQLQVENQQDDNWTYINYPSVLDSLLPSGLAEADKYPRNVRWLVTVRILPPFENEMELKFSLHQSDNGVEALVTEPEGASIMAQLEKLRKKYPDATVEKLSGLITIGNRTITEKECPQLRSLAREFESIRMSPVLEDDLRADDTTYEIWSQAQLGNKMLISLGGPGSNARKQPHVLISWAERVRRSLHQVCKSRG